jgi:UDP:flavonoid glycosyltransferase YjiC (YdhE family)
MESFRRVPQRVVWAFPHDFPMDAPDNVLVMSWIPQNDLLGHNNTKLFITHCGANGQFEGLYNAVPMIAMPLFGDQPYNAIRGQYKGIGIHMDILEFTPDELVAKIEHVINGPYKKNIDQLSKIFRSRPLNPVERSAYWIEHVLEHGGEHLHSHALDMPWWEYAMIDMLLFVLGVCVSFIVVFGLCVRALCCKHKAKQD